MAAAVTAVALATTLGVLALRPSVGAEGPRRSQAIEGAVSAATSPAASTRPVGASPTRRAVTLAASCDRGGRLTVRIARSDDGGRDLRFHLRGGKALERWDFTIRVTYAVRDRKTGRLGGVTSTAHGSARTNARGDAYLGPGGAPNSERITYEAAASSATGPCHLEGRA